MNNYKRQMDDARARDRQFLAMGGKLRAARLKKGLKLREVAASIGRKQQYVCEVEHGRAGRRMDPTTALMWSDYLGIDASEIFECLSVRNADVGSLRIRSYLETASWARRYVVGKRSVEESRKIVADMIVDARPKTLEHDRLIDLRDRLGTAHNALTIPGK